VTAIVFALLAAVTFGGMSVAVRRGLGEGGSATSALATLIPAFAIAAVASTIRHDYGGAWKFFLAGLIAPGLSQVTFTRAIKEAGAARVSVVAGTAPFAAVIVALVFLHEPFRVPVIIGGVVIVLGGLLLAAEKGRPGHVRTIGLLLGVFATTLFAVRDNLVRAIHAGASPETASVAILLAGVLVSGLWARKLPTRVEMRRMAPAGVLFGLSYLALFEAYFHGRVEIVSPLTATESLWAVWFTSIFLGKSEHVGRRVLIGALFVVAGGVLIGIYR
jgi:drug/metabolite transporter (DMT)-like permease